MDRRNRLIVLILIIMIASTAGCLYHKPEFSGQILDKETKQPIEGAVVVAVYNKEYMGVGAGANTKIINVRETLTNSDGKFHIPSYATLIVPVFSRESYATFVIFKPGYASISGANLEDLFMGEKGQEGGWQLLYTTETIRFSPQSVVELPKLKTWEERNKANMISVDAPKRELPLFNNMTEKEEIWLQQHKGWRE